MLRRLLSSFVVTAVVAVNLVATSPAAMANGPICGGGCPPGDGADAGAGGGTIHVTVWGSGVRAGGTTFEVAPSSSWVQPVCWYSFLLSGADYYDFWASGRAHQLIGLLPPEDHFEPFPGYEDHQDDPDGGWWSPRCSSAAWEGDISGFFEYTTEFFENNSSVYVPVGDVPPAVDVPPQLLAQVAFDAMELPSGDLDWNPRGGASGATVVEVPTWVWVQDSATQVSVTASVSSGTWARVDAGVDRVEVSAPGARPVTCGTVGVAWSADASASDACSLTFFRSSANQPVKAGQSVPTSTLTVTEVWTASWVSSLDSTPTALPDQEQTTTAEVPVAEIQTVVTSNG